MLRYLSRYTHRVAISNRRLIAADDAGVAFRWKDYRIDGPGRWKTMRLHPHEFIRRFLLHVPERRSPPQGAGEISPVVWNRFTQRTALAMLTLKCAAA